MSNKTFQVNVPYSGYSRGYIIYEVDAASAEEALEAVKDGAGAEVDMVVIRDDTDKDWCDAEVVQ